MTISTYADLQDAVRLWMLKASTDLVVTTNQIKNYIQLCESELNRELKVRELESDDVLVTVADQDYVDLPAGFKRIKDIYHESAPVDLSMLGSKGELKRKWGISKGRPMDYAIHGSKMFLGSTPDAVYNIILDFYSAVPALSDSNTTNDILTEFPDVYLYGALRHGFMNTKDSKAKAEAETNYATMIERIKNAEKGSRMPVNLRAKRGNRLA